MRTVIVHELVDPKAQVNSVKCNTIIVSFLCQKGIRVNIPEPLIGYFYGNVSEYGDNNRCPRKSSLFFLTVLKYLMTMESYCMEKWLDNW